MHAHAHAASITARPHSITSTRRMDPYTMLNRRHTHITFPARLLIVSWRKAMFPRSGMIALFTGLTVAAVTLTAIRRADAVPPLTSHDLALVDTITWGTNQSTMTAFLSLGRDRWLQSQLHAPPEERLPKVAQQQIDALIVSKRSAFDLAADFDAVARVANEMTDPDQ